MGCGPSVNKVAADAKPPSASTTSQPNKVSQSSQPQPVKEIEKQDDGEAGEDGGLPNEPLTAEEITSRIVSGKDTRQIPLQSGESLKLNIAWVSQRGFYPESLDKENQDAFFIGKEFGDDKRHALFGVFDGKLYF